MKILEKMKSILKGINIKLCLLDDNNFCWKIPNKNIKGIANQPKSRNIPPKKVIYVILLVGLLILLNGIFDIPNLFKNLTNE